MKKQTLIILTALASSAFADGLTGSLSLTNNYVARGTAQNYDQTPVLMANINYDYKGFYLGFFTANVDFQEDRLGIQENPTDRELSFWAGYRFTVKNVTIDSMFGSYNYTGDTFTALDMVEAKINLSIPVKKFVFSTSLGYLPDYFNILSHSVWADFSVSYQINDKLTVNAGIGRQFITDRGGSDVMPYNKDGYSYTTWNAGVNYTFNKNWSANISYYNTNRHDLGEIYSNNPYGNNISAALKFSF